MEDEIIGKIKSLLNKNMPLKEEAHIVYLLVEIRKVLEGENDPNYHLLKFYCDWSVHTKKSHITDAIKKQMEEIYKEIQMRDKIIDNLKTDIVPAENRLDFSHMGKLKEEMKRFFNDYNIPDPFPLLNDANWDFFVNTFTKILVDQKIENPCDGIEYFKFLPVNDGHVRYIIRHRTKEAEHKDYEFKDPYKLNILF